MSAINSTLSNLDTIPQQSLALWEYLLSTSHQFTTAGATFNQLLPYAASAVESTTVLIRSIPQYLSWSNVINIILLTLLVANAKCLPFVYHLRILNGLRHVLKSQRPPQALTPEQLFQPLITSSRGCLMEMDVYGHKNNNTYFTDHDIARTHLLTTMFTRGIEKIRGSVVMNGLSGHKRSAFTIPLGAVCCSFRKELKPYEQYDMWTRILSWDEKWLYVVTHFVKKGAKIEPEEMTYYRRQNSTGDSSKASRRSSTMSLDSRRSSQAEGAKVSGSAIAASALSKVVFKDGRVTIAPAVMLEASGLLPPATTSDHHSQLAGAQVEANENIPVPEAVGELEKVEGSDDASDASYESSRRSSVLSNNKKLTRAEVEAERVRGLSLAKMLAGQTELEHELRNEVALGRHYDGVGIEGVIATLLQLGKLSSYQLL